MKQPLISIVTPVYCVEQFLPKCLDSIMAQSFCDWECILVDDGSSDNSGRICDEYASRDGRFRVFHKENGGVSSARNLGLDYIRGEFVTFIDADDYVGPDYLHLFASHKDYDLVFTGLHRVGSVDQKWFGDEEIAFPTIKDLAEAWMDKFESKHLTLGGLNFVACKALRAKYILENSIRFDARMKKGEDTCFVYEWMHYAKNAIQVKGNEYFYYTPAEGHNFRMTLEQYQMHCNLYREHIESIRKEFGAFSQKQLDSYVVSTFCTYYQTFFKASISYVRTEAKRFLQYNQYPVIEAIKREKGEKCAWSVQKSFEHPVCFYLILRFRRPYYGVRKMLRIFNKYIIKHIN